MFSPYPILIVLNVAWTLNSKLWKLKAVQSDSEDFLSNGVDNLANQPAKILEEKDAISYSATWDSIDSRPIPKWYDEAKFGIFVHWGVFSVPSFGTEWFWWYWKDAKDPKFLKYMRENYRPNFAYADFAPSFTAEFYDSDQWATLFANSGAKYVVLTSKHAEGFALWPSNYSWNWNAGDIGPSRDLVGDLVHKLTSHKLKVGLYYCLYEWFNPLFLRDQANNYTTNAYVKTKVWPQLMELHDRYGPDLIWADGDVGPSEYWRSKEYIAHLYNNSPKKATIVTNDRWGSDADCKHGGYLTCEDKYNPGTILDRKWERCDSMDHRSWGLRREATLTQLMTMPEILGILLSTVSYGGNLLLNVGASHDGRIIPIFQERLSQIGSWLRVNGEAIYATKPWVYAKEDHQNIWYTEKCGGDHCTLYATFLNWPSPAENRGVSRDNQTWLSLKKVRPLQNGRATGVDALEIFLLIPSTTPDKSNVTVVTEEYPLEWDYNNDNDSIDDVNRILGATGKRSSYFVENDQAIKISLNCPVMLNKLMKTDLVSSWAWVLKLKNYEPV